MASSLHDVPGTHKHQSVVRAHAAATTTELVHVFEAPFAARITGVYLRPDAAITGADTNTTHVNLLNGGVDGDGTTELDNIDFVSGTDAAAGERLELYAPADGLDVAAGTVLIIQLEKVSSGLALPQFSCIVEYEGA